MNHLLGNAYNSRDLPLDMGAHGKKNLPYQSESLFGMALYDFDTMAYDVGMSNPLMHRPMVQQPIFHPVDEYKDLSLKEILDLSDDFLSGTDQGKNNSNNHSSGHDQLLGNPSMPHQGNLGDSLPFHAPVMMDPNINSYDPYSTEQLMVLNVDSLSQHQHHHHHHHQQQHEMFLNNFQQQMNNNNKKRDREDDMMSANSDEARERRFRPYQAGQWAEKFEELCAYKKKEGHCLVPHTFNDNLALARWVKRQRYQYKLMMEGKASTMTPERVKALEDLGFVWDSQGAAWGDRLHELEEFRKAYMHCNVPSNFSDNPRLATWIKCQRRQYKLYMEGKPSNMTPQRIHHLESLGFEWELRVYKKQRTSN
jgi:Helicase associated domain